MIPRAIGLGWASCGVAQTIRERAEAEPGAEAEAAAAEDGGGIAGLLAGRGREARN